MPQNRNILTTFRIRFRTDRENLPCRIMTTEFLVDVIHSGGEMVAVATKTDYAIEARGVSKRFGEGESAVNALRGVTVGFERGAFTAIMGASGSGKSTLMQCAAGLDAVTDGDVVFDGMSLMGLSDTDVTKLRRDHMGFVFQSFNLLPAFTARQNIELPLRIAGKRLDKEWFGLLVRTLGIEDRLDHRPSEMSGGQQQRVAIARALINRPSVVFCDEPTGALDTRSGHQVLEFLRYSVDELDSTIVMVTHDPVAASYADRVIYLADGRIAGEDESPTTDSVLARIRTLGGQ
jgi:putative ABC transport system ATP-binding protein